MQQEHSVHLVNSTYSADDASNVLYSLINDKIRFLQGQILSRGERFGDECAHLKNRCGDLKEAKEQINQLIAEAKDNGYDLRIECPINISFVPAQEAVATEVMAKAEA